MARTEVGKTVYAMLAADATLTALVSTKIYPVIAPQNVASPFVVYSIASAIPTNTKDRISEVDTMRVQIDCYARTYSQVEAIASAARLAIDGQTGTKAGIYVDGVAYENEQDLIDEDVDLYRKSLDFFIRIKY